MKSLDEYMDLPYHLEIIGDEDGTFLVSVKELRGCLSEGDTLDEAYNMIKDAMKAWIGIRLEKGLNIPEPEEEKLEFLI